jgi:hypothetical protein
MTRWKRLRLATVVSALLAVFSIIALAGPASAAPGGSAAPAKAAVEKAAVQKIALNIAVTPSYAVICYVYIDPAPYETGTGYSGYRENINASTTCTKPVTFLRMQIYLFLNGGAWGYDSVTGTSYITGTASGPCLSGTYYGEVNVEIIWPAGVTGPPSYTATSQSITVPSCI